MSDKFKQFKNELIDLCEKHGCIICTEYDPMYIFEDTEEEDYIQIGIEIDKNTPKEDI